MLSRRPGAAQILGPGRAPALASSARVRVRVVVLGPAAQEEAALAGPELIGHGPRGLPQLGTLGAGNHYAEIQVVDQICNPSAAQKMGIDFVGQICVMIHSGSRGFGHH